MPSVENIEKKPRQLEIFLSVNIQIHTRFRSLYGIIIIINQVVMQLPR